VRKDFLSYTAENAVFGVGSDFH
jgi:hypothetical protein